ncbi:hypothetical protein ACQW02_17190 [Humitalea sp. 24SJ18S-53]|uniref:hypothetical protein n=1 Tax=Humitalea sp. 24SJ18S-53 TaxID=3422307 RepID=UPI003D667875
MMYHIRRSNAVAVALVVVGLANGAAAQDTGLRPGWSFDVAPYVWLPTVGANLRYHLPGNISGTADVSADPGTYTDELNFALAFAGSARYDRFTLLTDFMYVSASASTSNVESANIIGVGRNPISSVDNIGTDSTLKTTLWTLAGGYTLASGPWGHVDAIGGFRYLGIDASTNYNLSLQLMGPRGNAGPTFGGSGRLSGSDNIWNGIVGLRGRLRLGEGGFFLPYYVDVGTGDSNLTWQAFGGIGYQTGPVGVSLGWRYLSFDQGGNSLVRDMTMSGAYLAVNFSF